MEGLPDALVHLVLQFATEGNWPGLAQKLLQQTAVLFDIEYFMDQISKGEWDTVERYLTKFTKPEDNAKSANTFFLLIKQKYLEAMAKNDAEEALNVLENELQVFEGSHKKQLANLAKILRMKKFRGHKMVSEIIKDIKASRTKLADEIVKLVRENSMFHRKLELPIMEKERLLKIIMRSLEWQHKQCKNPRDIPKFKSLYTNHSCDQPDEAPGPSSVPPLLIGNIPDSVSGSLPIGATTEPLVPHQESVTYCIASQTPAQPLSVPSAPSRKKKPVREALLKDQTVIALKRKSKDQTVPHMKRKPPLNKLKDKIVLPMKRKSAAVNQKEKSKRISARRRDEKASDLQADDTILQDPNPQQNVRLTNDLPLDVVMSLPHDSRVESMDFHPSVHSLLLAGTKTGDILLWELSGKKILVQESFRIWELENDPIPTYDEFEDDAGSSPSVNKVKWSSDGAYFAVTFTNGIVHVYTYLGKGYPKEHTEIEAHEGHVFDVAFTNHENELWVITCGDDLCVKVWEASTGASRYSFDDFEAPVCSVYPQRFNCYPAIYAADSSGTVSILLYNDKTFKFSMPLPKQITACIAFSADGPRFFVGGANDADESCIVELSPTGSSVIKHSYNGLAKRCAGYIYYDIVVKGKYLAAVDNFLIKFWEMDNNNLLKTIDAEGGIFKSSYIKFNKKGTLLAVTTEDDCIKILANAVGKRLLQAKGKCALDASSTAAATQTPEVSFVSPVRETSAPRRSASRSPMVRKNVGSSCIFYGKSRMAEEPRGLSELWSSNEINECMECISEIIPNKFSGESVQVSWLAYTKSGRAILVLGSNGEHKLWEWPKTAKNPNGKATSKTGPKLWQAPDNIQMVNDVGYANPEGRVSCFALPRNRHYVLSASGGIVSVHDITTFKTLAKIMPSPPAATALAIHPKDSNTLVFGMEDSSIQIFQFRTHQISSKLDGHSKRVTGLAFSDVLNVLISSGADSQLCVWSIDEWKKLGNTFLQVPHGRTSDTRVQFHTDQTCLLAVHKTQIAIYRAPELTCLNKWIPEDANSLITHAAYSCDCESIFVTFRNGSVGVLTASSLDLKCRINPTSFIPPQLMKEAFPLVVAAHPSEPNQFALGLSDGAVVVVEPKEATWGTPQPDPLENEAGPSSTPGVIDLDQLVWDEEEEEEDI